jgi:PAS domain S-box-containing protein
MRLELARERKDSENERRALAQVLQELEASRERYVDLYDFAPVGYMTLSRSGCIVSVNLTAADLLGYSRPHLIGRPLMPLVARADRRPFLKHLMQTTGLGKKPATIHLRIPRKNGGHALLQFLSCGCHETSPRMTGIRTVITEVTEQRRTEEDQRRLAAIVEFSDDAIVCKDLDGIITNWNRGAERLFGYSAREVIGKSILLLIPEERHGEEGTILNKIRHGQSVEHYDTLRRRKDGSEVPISLTVSPIKDVHGRVIGASKIARDITRRKQAEEGLRRAKAELEDRVRLRTAELTETNSALQAEVLAHQQTEKALRESEAWLQAIMDNSPAMIFLKDAAGRYLHYNREFGRAFHLSQEDAIGKTDFELFPRAQAEVFQSHDRKVIVTGRPVQFEEVAMQDDGPHTSIVSKFPLYDGEGRIHAVAGIVTDITEHRRLEEEVLRISEHERMRIAQDMHDGLGQQLAGTWFLADSLRKNLSAVSSPEAPAAAKIVQLLDTAVSQSRNLARGLYPVPHEPNGLISALEELSQQTSELFQVDCRFVCRRAVLIEDYDVATHLYRIAQEAINNAIKHGRAHSIVIGLSARAGHLVLRIRDDGVGFKNVTNARKGMGLRTMNHRADLIGAHFAIHHAGNCGSEVVCGLRTQLTTLVRNGKAKRKKERSDKGPYCGRPSGVSRGPRRRARTGARLVRGRSG